MATSSKTDMDRAVDTVRQASERFGDLGPGERARILKETVLSIVASADEWVKAACEAKRIPLNAPVAGEEWTAGPVVTVRNARLLAETLTAVEKRESPPFGRGGPHVLTDGTLECEVFPTCRTDAAAASGFVCRVRFPRGATLEEVRATQALEARKTPYHRRRQVCLVLGAGNVSSIPAMDVLSKMFVEGYVCVLKMNPVNEWLGPVLEKALAPIVKRDFLRIVYGGAEEGEYLCRHDGIAAVHVTGSSATHDAIVWGPPGEERDRRKKANDPLTAARPVTSELGNVSPVLIMPVEYTDEELAMLAMNVASMKTNNAGCNCNAAQVLVTAEGWRQRDRFLELLFGTFVSIPTRYGYYPGAAERLGRLQDGHRPLWSIGDARDPSALPWTIAYGLDPDDPSEPLFREEAFCPLLAETALPCEYPTDFLVRAAMFANMRLTGSLNATIMAPPSAFTDRDTAEAVERAVGALRYGTVSVNHWAGLTYGLVSPPWGACPGGTLQRPGSGIGWVHNTYMLEGMEKVIVRGPFMPSPKPPWFANNRNAHEIGRRLVGFEASPSWLKLPKLAAAAMKG